MPSSDRCAGEREAIAYLRTPVAIRERSENVFARGLDDQLEHFSVRLDRLPAAAERVARVTRATYPDLEIPCHSRWSHFQVGGVDRLEQLQRKIAGLDRVERARCRLDLVVTSVLLDAPGLLLFQPREERSARRRKIPRVNNSRCGVFRAGPVVGP